MRCFKKIKCVFVVLATLWFIPLVTQASTVGDINLNDQFRFTNQQEKELDTLIKSFGNGVSVFYKDLESGYTYTYNEDQKYFIASLIKAPYCMYVYDLASQGKCDLSKHYIYESRHRAGGTGKIQDMSVGMSFTLEELIGYAIKYSDNVAMNIIKENFPVEGYRVYAKELGLKYPEDIKYATNGEITAIDAGVYMEAINEFIEHNIYGPKLKLHMLSTRNPMITANYPIIRKYGWADASFHDMAIVEAPYPYLLSICTNHDGDFGTFKKISQLIEKYSQSGREMKINTISITNSILIDEKRMQISGFNINNNNYYRLRDIAYLLNGTHKQFDVVYDTEKSGIVIQLGKSYLGEKDKENVNNLKSMEIVEKQVSFYMQDQSYQFLGYIIDGSTYIKIRDFVELLDIEIKWSNELKEIALIT